jgi:hypothetical protein
MREHEKLLAAGTSDWTVPLIAFLKSRREPATES